MSFFGEQSKFLLEDQVKKSGEEPRMSASMNNANDNILEQERLLLGKVLELEKVIWAKGNILVAQEQQIRAISKATGNDIMGSNMSLNQI